MPLKQTSSSCCGWIQLPRVKGLIVSPSIAFQEQQCHYWHLTKAKCGVVSDTMYPCTAKTALSRYRPNQRLISEGAAKTNERVLSRQLLVHLLVIFRCTRSELQPSTFSHPQALSHCYKTSQFNVACDPWFSFCMRVSIYLSRLTPQKTFNSCHIACLNLTVAGSCVLHEGEAKQ